MINRKYGLILTLVSLLPLLVYPFVLIANIMSFAAGDVQETPLLLTIASKGFLYASTFYPISVLVALVFHFINKKGKLSYIPLLPYAHLMIIALLMVMWVAVS